MKKILLAAFAALAITGCSQNEEFDEQGVNNEIKIGTVVKGTSRAAVLINDNFENFTLSAFIVEKDQDYKSTGLGAAYMDELEYAREQGSWAITGSVKKYYWPTKNVQFFGWSPAATAVESKELAVPTTGYPSLKYTIAGESASQKDIVVAAKSMAKPEGNIATLDFKHILTKINFAYKGGDAGYKYKVTSITLKNIQGGDATYTFAADPASGNWGAGSVQKVSYAYPVTSTEADAGDYINLDSTDGSLLLLPQQLATDAAVDIEYIVTGDGNYTYTGTKSIKISGTWTIGQNLRYKLALPAGEGEVGINTNTLPDWNAEGSSEI